MSAVAAGLEQQIDALLAAPTFSLAPAAHQARLLALLQQQLTGAADRDERLRRYLDAWPCDYRVAKSIADLPYLPVGAFKVSPPLTLSGTQEIVDRKSTRLNSSHSGESRMPSSA